MKFGNRVKNILYTMEFTHGIRRALIMALALVYFVQMGFSVVWITTMFAVASLISVLMEFPTGAIADYDSRKKSLMISFFLFTVGFLGIFFASNFWIIAVFWTLSEVAWAFNTGAGGAWATDALGIWKNKKELLRLISREYMFEKGGHIIGGIIGLVIIAINFRLIWLVGALTNFIVLIIVWKYMEEKNFKPHKVPHNYIVKSLIKAKESYAYIIHKKNWNLRIIFFGGFLIAVAVNAFFVGMPLMFTEVLGLKPESLAGLLGGLAVLSFFSPLIAENIGNKKGFGKSYFYFVIGMGISMIVFGLSSSLIYAVITFAIFQILMTAFDVIEDSASNHAFESKIRASLGSIGSINNYIASAIGVFLAGIGIEFLSIEILIIISGLLGILVAFVYLFGIRE